MSSLRNDIAHLIINIKPEEMRKFKLLLIAVPFFMLACNSQPKADKNMQDDAILIEDAKVREQKTDNTNVEKQGTDTAGMVRDTVPGQ